MKRILSLAMLSVFSLNSSHALENLDDSSLQRINGQAGADLSLNLNLNQMPLGTAIATNMDRYNPALAPQFDTALCPSGQLEYCRLGITFNNRTVDGSGNPTGDMSGKKQWIMLKGVQGTVNIQKLGLDGVTLSYIQKGSSSTIVNKSAIKLTFDTTKPIQIRNLGFQSLAIETDSVAGDGVNGNGVNAGYLSNTKYTSSDGAYDANNPWFSTVVGREKGFLGVNMNANLQIAGTVKMFSCAGSDGAAHPRC